MNRILSILSSRIITRRNCCIARRATIYPEARIQNNAGKKELILIGDNSHIRGELLVFAHGGKINISSYCYVGEGSRIWSAKEITIGDRVLVSHNVNIFDSLTHPISSIQRHQQFRAIIANINLDRLDLNGKSVHIDSDVLIGCNAIILKGITIGEGAIVGAGSVVTKNVPPWTIVAGNPATIIREIPEYER